MVMLADERSTATSTARPAPNQIGRAGRSAVLVRFELAFVTQLYEVVAAGGTQALTGKRPISQARQCPVPSMRWTLSPDQCRRCGP